MKDTRIEFRSSPQEKDLLMLAAQLTGVNVSVFLRNAAIQAANEAVQASETMKLSNRDRDLFLHALDHPPAPNPKLKKAMKKYRQWK
jgi:uncharacterized protein (DUF1778 family)